MLRELLESRSPAQRLESQANSAKSQLLPQILRRRAIQQGGELALAFLQPDATPAIELSYADMDRRARAVAASMQNSRGLKQCLGTRAVLIFQPGFEFTVAFLGCLYAGVMAAPIYAAHPAQFKRFIERLTGILDDAEPSFILTTSSYVCALQTMLDGLPSQRLVTVIAIDGLEAGIEMQWQEPTIDGNTIAFLQYTSGSTSKPKAVMVNHANLSYNLTAIRRAIADVDEPKVVSWLPPYHDMGLIGGILQPLFAGYPCWLMSPLDFLMRPAVWLQAITRFRATVSPLPNFALDLCVRKISDGMLKQLDLSTWRVAINGAEPIRKDWLDRFSEKFAVCGFSPEVHRPAYGLAEATLMVSCGTQGTVARTMEVRKEGINHDRVELADSKSAATRTVVSCGKSIAGQTIAIVNPHTMNRCKPGEIGEIWVKGPSIAQGYWNKTEESLRTFNAFIADAGEGPFLRTGDLGFLDDDELFVTGRCKDLIIIEGKNYYPHDIEVAIEQTPLPLRVTSSAAFSIDDNGSERLIIVVELENRRLQNAAAERFDSQDIVRQLRQSVCASIGIDAHDIKLVARGAMPRTSSGKIQRYKCRDGYLSDALDELA